MQTYRVSSAGSAQYSTRLWRTHGQFRQHTQTHCNVRRAVKTSEHIRDKYAQKSADSADHATRGSIRTFTLFISTYLFCSEHDLPSPDRSPLLHSLCRSSSVTLAFSAPKKRHNRHGGRAKSWTSAGFWLGGQCPLSAWGDFLKIWLRNCAFWSISE